MFYAGDRAMPMPVSELEVDEETMQQQVLEGLPWAFTITREARAEWASLDPPNRHGFIHLPRLSGVVGVSSCQHYKHSMYQSHTQICDCA